MQYVLKDPLSVVSAKIIFKGESKGWSLYVDKGLSRLCSEGHTSLQKAKDYFRSIRPPDESQEWCEVKASDEQGAKISSITFCKEEIKLIQAFGLWWDLNNIKDPIKYPSEMAPGDWDEQFVLWAETYEQPSNPCRYFNTAVCQNPNCTDGIRKRCGSFKEKE